VSAPDRPAEVLDTTAIREWMGGEHCSLHVYTINFVGGLCDEIDRLRASLAATPEGLSEEERVLVDTIRRSLPDDLEIEMPWSVFAQSGLLAIIDRLTGGPK